MAATRLQSHCRCRAAKQDVHARRAHQREAALQIQSLERGRQERQQGVAQRREASAISLQALSRGRLSRWQLRERHAAAVKVQAHTRGFLAVLRLEDDAMAAYARMPDEGDLLADILNAARNADLAAEAAGVARSQGLLLSAQRGQAMGRALA